jgi:hypothetical protein
MDWMENAKKTTAYCIFTLEKKGTKILTQTLLKLYILYFIYTLKLGELENSLQREHDVIMTQSCVYCLFPFPHSLILLESGCTLAFHLSL